jgi:hypothetical protein
MTMQAPPKSSFQELDYRETDGLEIWLLWSQATNTVTVVVHDTKAQDVLEVDVEPEHARDAFAHPYAYLGGLSTGEPALDASCTIATEERSA